MQEHVQRVFLVNDKLSRVITIDTRRVVHATIAIMMGSAVSKTFYVLELLYVDASALIRISPCVLRPNWQHNRDNKNVIVLANEMQSTFRFVALLRLAEMRELVEQVSKSLHFGARETRAKYGKV